MSTHCKSPGCIRPTFTPSGEVKDSYKYCYPCGRAKMDAARRAGYFQELPEDRDHLRDAGLSYELAEPSDRYDHLPMPKKAGP